jgi:hypothetical protein
MTAVGVEKVVSAGSRAKIEAGIRELNFGEIHFLDADGKPL